MLIPTYNYARYLPQAIESLLRQTWRPFEIIVADDGSTDDTSAVVARYGSEVKYCHFSHRGVYALRQSALSNLQGEWFVNLDADNWVAQDFIEQLAITIRRHENDKTFAFAYPDMELFGDSFGRVKRPAFDVRRLKRSNYLDMNSAIQTSVAQKFNFDPHFNSGQGDYDFFLTLAKNGYWGVHVPEAILHYRVHTASITSGVRRKRQQRKIMKRLLRKHTDFFTREEARLAMQAATNRYWVSLIEARSPFAGLGCRLNELWQFVRGGLNHAEIFQQARYAVSPTVYFQRRYPAADVFYLFRDTAERRRAIARLPAMDLNQTQLFGYAELLASGLSMDCNLCLPRTSSMRETVAGWREQWYAPRAGGGLGDVTAVRAHLWQMNRARVVVATTDNTGLPAARLKARGKLRAKLIYISVGLPERMAAVRKISPAREARYRRMLSHVDQFIAYGHAEAEWLREWLGASDKVQFIPFGVDVQQWQPKSDAEEVADVVSVGADPLRDFELLLEYARQRPAVHVQLVVGRDAAQTLRHVPPNVTVHIQLPVDQVRDLMARAGVLVLPVKENTYSGATTTLLQGMALGKAVAVSRVGAIRDGYGFADGVHLRWMEPGALTSLTQVVDELLAHPAQREPLGAAARTHVVAELGWEKYVGHLRRILQQATR